MASTLGYRPDDVLYTCLPLFHGNAIWYTCYAALWADACVALSPRFSARRFWDEIRDERRHRVQRARRDGQHHLAAAAGAARSRPPRPHRA